MLPLNFQILNTTPVEFDYKLKGSMREFRESRFSRPIMPDGSTSYGSIAFMINIDPGFFENNVQNGKIIDMNKIFSRENFGGFEEISFFMAYIGTKNDKFIAKFNSIRSNSFEKIFNKKLSANEIFELTMIFYEIRFSYIKDLIKGWGFDELKVYIPKDEVRSMGFLERDEYVRAEKNADGDMLIFKGATQLMA